MTHEELFTAAMKNPEVRAEYEKFDPEMALLDAKLARRKQKLTQREIASRMGTTREIVARLESSHRKHTPSLRTWSAYLNACGVRLEYKITGVRRAEKTPTEA